MFLEFHNRQGYVIKLNIGAVIAFLQQEEETVVICTGDVRIMIKESVEEVTKIIDRMIFSMNAQAGIRR
jgi:hypothetical protein